MLDELKLWCEKKVISLQQQIDLIEGRAMTIQLKEGDGWKDCSRVELAKAKEDLACLHRLIAVAFTTEETSPSSKSNGLLDRINDVLAAAGP
jgi:hypothetical protein